MRVLLVGNHWTEGPGGAETMLVVNADLLRAVGHEVVPFAVAEEGTLPTPVRDRLPAAAGSGARTRFGEAWAGAWSPRAYRALARVVVEVRPDVAHVHHVFERLTPSVLDALRHARVPTVMTVHDYKPACPNYRLFTENAAAVAAALSVAPGRDGERLRAAAADLPVRFPGFVSDVRGFLAGLDVSACPPDGRPCRWSCSRPWPRGCRASRPMSATSGRRWARPRSSSRRATRPLWRPPSGNC